MSELGTLAVLLGLALSLYAAVGSVAGHVLRIEELVVSARRSAYMVLAAAGTASGALIAAFVSHDFSIKYVAEHSNRAMDPGYTWVALYAGNEGSLLYIALALALASAIAIRLSPPRLARSMPWTTAILCTILAFYFFVIAFFASPFQTLSIVPPDGRGINPLLTHPGMFMHPPMLMAGLVGITLPFAYAAGALISGDYGDNWIDIGRVSAILVWGILGTGLLLGAWWAYTILGWGGYWGWDPIENVALMPWLVLTAFIHSVMVQKRRGMFRMWNIVLLIISFVLAQLGMFINRGGPVVSVHSFAASALGQIFLSFMLLTLVASFALFVWRMPHLRSERPIESFLSREAAFLVNNFLLLLVAFATLWGVIFPLFSDLAQGAEVSVAAPYYNRVNGPLLLMVILVMGIGPLLPWRRTTGKSLKAWLLLPVAGGLVTAVMLVLSGIREPLAVLAFGVIAFVFLAIFEEWYRGSASRHRAGEAWAVAWWKMVNGNRPRHGGYVAHIAVLMLAIGVVGTQFFDQRTDVVLSPGESLVLDNYRIEYLDVNTSTRPDRIARWANLNIYSHPGDRLIGTLQPWHGLYTNFNQVSVLAGIRSTPLEDLYIIPSDFLDDGRVLLRVSINPLAMWLWIAGPVFLIGTGIALWPQPALESRAARTAHAAAARSAEA